MTYITEKLPNKKILLLFFMCFCCYSGVPVYANLEFEINAHKKNLFVGEPLYLSVSISNDGTDSEEIKWIGKEYYSNKSSLGKIFINGAEYDNNMRPPNKIYKSVSPRTLEPGEEINEFFVVFYDWNKKETVFKREDKNKIYLQYGSTKTDPITINVSRPKTQKDRKALKDFLAPNKLAYAKLINAPWQVNTKYSLKEKERKMFLNHVENEPQTVYTPYIALSLARHYYTLYLTHKNILKHSPENSQHAYKQKAENLFDKTLSSTNNKILEALVKNERNTMKSKNRIQLQRIAPRQSLLTDLKELKKKIHKYDITDKTKKALIERLQKIIAMQKGEKGAKDSGSETSKKEVEKELKDFILGLKKLDGSRINEDHLNALISDTRRILKRF